MQCLFRQATCVWTCIDSRASFSRVVFGGCAASALSTVVVLYFREQEDWARGSQDCQPVTLLTSCADEVLQANFP